jgi:endoglucanase
MKRVCFSIAAAAVSLLLLAAGLSACGGGSGGAAGAPTSAVDSGTTGTGTTGTTPAMREITSLELSKELSPGWNLGNSLEAYDTNHPYVWGSTNFSEQAWGNPKATQALMNGVKAAGFKFVRIPVAWVEYADANDNISPQWMARVTEVVNYARNAGLYVMINIHDGAWLNQLTYDKQAANNARLTKIWTQIANNFKDFDDYLLFAAQNETSTPNTYGAPTAEWQAVQNSYNQTFVNAVRATGGNNAKRHLIVQTYGTNIDNGYTGFVVPSDTTPNRLFVEVHFYDPYKMTLVGDSPTYTWGSTSTDPDGNWATETWMDSEFQKMKSRFIDNGIPVILGEYGAISKTEYDPTMVWRKYWAQYVTHSAFSHGVVPVWWDNGYTGNHGMGLMDRNTGAPAIPEMVSTIMNAAK